MARDNHSIQVFLKNAFNSLISRRTHRAFLYSIFSCDQIKVETKSRDQKVSDWSKFEIYPESFTITFNLSSDLKSWVEASKPMTIRALEIAIDEYFDVMYTNSSIY